MTKSEERELKHKLHVLEHARQSRLKSTILLSPCIFRCAYVFTVHRNALSVISNLFKSELNLAYICDILQEHSLVSENTFVRIVDISKVNSGVNFRNASLGKVNCSTYERDFP